MKATSPATTKKRIIALDYLRGFFIAVIIIDHLWRWPNIFEYITGRGELWTSAAEGFVLISGLLVGYVRGHKDRNKPLIAVSKVLVKRGVMLYAWMLITTFVLVWLSWTLTFKGEIAYIPIAQGDWYGLLISVLRLDYVHSLTHFLYLYAIFLIIAPGAIWLMRRGLSWIIAIISILVWAVGYNQDIEWMQWQVVFFLPSIAGFYMDKLFEIYAKLPLIHRKAIRYGSIAITLVTMYISAWMILPVAPGEVDLVFFSREPLTWARVLLSFVWFIGLLSLFQMILPYMKKYLGWLLLPFGERSLTAYIVHVVPLFIFQLLIAKLDGHFWINSFLALACVMLTWGILKIPHINKVIPR